MKRRSQNRNEHQKAPTKATKDPGDSEKTQPIHVSNGSPAGYQPAAPSTAMEFSFKGSAVRPVSHAGGTWFVAADVCAVLEHTDPSAALLRLDKDEKGATTVRTLGGNQRMNVVTESGLYHLVLTSRKRQAKVFRRWVTETVLPSIRQTGGYQSGDDARTARACGDARHDAVTVALPGPGRYVATVMPDGEVRVHETEYSALLEEMTLADCRILCHTLHIIEGQWHKYQHRQSIASDRQDEFGLARLEAAILDGSRLAARCLKWHSGFEEERPGL